MTIPHKDKILDRNTIENKKYIYKVPCCNILGMDKNMAVIFSIPIHGNNFVELIPVMSPLRILATPTIIGAEMIKLNVPRVLY